MQELLNALHAAKSKFDPVLKDRANPFFDSKYATLASVLKAIGPALDDQGLMVVQTTEAHGEHGINLRTTLYHLESGDTLTSVWPLHPVKRDPQGDGSALTYGRRYALMTMFGLNAEDDDGNASTQRRDTKDWDALLKRCTSSQQARELGNECAANDDLTPERKTAFSAKIAELEAAEAAAAKSAEPTVEGVAEALGAEVTG